MTGPATNSFQRALDRFKRSLTQDLIDQFSICTLQDVQNTCKEIQSQHGMEGKLQHMRRLEPFIEGMEQFGKVIEIFLQIADLRKGPIKFLLGIAKTHIDSFNKLLDTYQKIGDAIPGLQQYAAAFEKYPALAAVLEDYYSDILTFHQAALVVFTRPRWNSMFHSTWKTFDSKFAPILQSLTSRRELLDSEKTSAALFVIDQVRQDVLTVLEEQRKGVEEQRRRIAQEALNSHKDRVSKIKQSLQVPNYQDDQETAAKKRYSDSSGAWILEEPNFRAWHNNEENENGILYVNGIPGAGKTTLMSFVIEKLQDSKPAGAKKHCLAYFYFKHQQSDKEEHNSLLRALLEQLINQDPDVSDHLVKEITLIEGTKLRSTTTLERLVKEALGSYTVSYLVIDGLDECVADEAAKSIEYLSDLVMGGFGHNNVILRVLFCGQRDGTLDKLLAHHPSITLEASAHIEDITRFCQGESARIRKKFDISVEMEQDISIRVRNEAQGMFLYAYVVLQNLHSQTRLVGLKQELAPGTFPKGIEKAYERVAVRIFDDSSPAEREDAMRILGWIVCAKRLLRWREIQSVFCIDPMQGTIDYEENRLRVSCKELCGSFVDIQYEDNRGTGPDDIIKIVHETAREYLVRNEYLHIGVENAKIAIYCSEYLLSEPFRCGIHDEDVTEHAVIGYYALIDYAVQYWYDHFRGCGGSTTIAEAGDLQKMMELARDFLASYGISSKLLDIDCIVDYEGFATVLKTLPQDGSERNEWFNIEHRISNIRQKLETITQGQISSSGTNDVFKILYGTMPPYKCPKPWCKYFAAGFESPEERKQHTNRHELPFNCSFENCFAFQLGYDTQSKLENHIAVHHPKPSDELEFPKVTAKKILTDPRHIIAAIRLGDLAAVEKLLELDTSVSYKEGLILYAARSGHLHITKFLIEKGYNIDNKGNKIHGSLNEAVNTGNSNMVRLLLSYPHCEPDATDQFGRSPFCEACALGDIEIVKLLLGTGKVNIYRRSYNPKCCEYRMRLNVLTPFGYACIQGHLAVVQYLLQQGQPAVVDRDLFEEISEMGHQDVLELLRPAEAKLIPKSLGVANDVGLDNYTLPNVKLAHRLQIEGSVYCLKFSVDGSCLAVGCRGVALIYDVKTGDMVHVLPCGEIRDLCFGLNDKYLIANIFGMNNPVVWEIQSENLSYTLSGHTGEVFSLSVTPNGRTVVSGGFDNTVRLWNIETGSNVFTWTCGVSAVAVSDTHVAAGCEDGSVIIWSLIDNKPVEVFNDIAPGTSCSFRSDGRSLSRYIRGGDCKIWQLDARRASDKEHTIGRGQVSSIGLKIYEYERVPFALVSLTDIGCIVTAMGGSRGRLQTWNRGRDKVVDAAEFAGHNDIRDIAASPAGGSFATISLDQGEVRIWTYVPNT